MEQARKDRGEKVEKARDPADKPVKIPPHPAEAAVKVRVGKAADRVRAPAKAREKVKAADKAGAKRDND